MVKGEFTKVDSICRLGSFNIVKKDEGKLHVAV
jgi:hypothetical protein